LAFVLNEYSAPTGVGVLADGMLMFHNELLTRMRERGNWRARSGYEAGQDVMRATRERRLTGRYAPQLRIVITVSGLVFNAAWPGFVQAQGSSTTERVEFEIPEQALAAALERYMSLSNVTIVVDSAVIGARRSSAVHGALSQDGALQSLLEGTGLDSRRIGPAAYTLVPLQEGAEAAPRLPRFLDYAAAVQRAVTLALCRMNDTSPIRYRTVVRLWLQPDGRVRQAELAISTGSASRDGAITGVLGGVTVGAAVPRNLPQPIKLAIAPRRSDDAACSTDPGLARPSLQLGVGLR